MNFNSAPDRHRWLSSNSMMVAVKLATSYKSNWKIAKLGDIAERISTGTTPPSQERRYYDGDIDWFTPADIGGNRWLSAAKKSITNEAISEKKGRTFDSETILITCIGHIGRVGILSKTSSANQQITGIKFNKIIDPEFAYYGLFARQDELQAAAPTASTLSILNQSRLSNINFCFPSLKEQIQISKFLSWYEDRLIDGQPFTNDYPTLPDYLSDLPRIVERVEALAARIAKAQSLRNDGIDEIDAFWKSLLSKTFLPDKSTQRTVEESCEAIIDNLHATPRYDGNQFHCVRSQDIGWGTMNYSTMLKTSEEEFLERIRRGEPRKDDIVFVREGDIGRCAVLDGAHRLSLGQRVMMLRPDTSRIIPNFLMYQLMSSPVLVDQLLSGKKGTTSHHLNISHFRKVKINVPPLDEQRRIVAYLDSVQARLTSLRELQSATGEELSALLPSVLDRAFKGEL
ncbi:MAG: restriction endonuclease subunit S [Anaerolineales bacterium]|nr:restriction endonuclease subunit S [Anaerolineales bacterium]